MSLSAPRSRYLPSLSPGILALGLTGGCAAPPPTAFTLEGAFERVASAIDAGDARRLYWDLALPTRWSLMSIHRNRQTIRRVVATDYPPEERPRAVGRWEEGGEARDEGSLFAALCARRNCLEPLRATIGAVERIERTADGGVVTTVRGGTYRFEKGQDGRYGLLGFGEEIAALERDVHRDLEVIQRSAAEYRRAQARPATGPRAAVGGEKDERHGADRSDSR